MGTPASPVRFLVPLPAIVLLAACATGGVASLAPSPPAPTMPSSTAAPTPPAARSPSPSPTATPAPTERPAMEVAGRLAVTIVQPPTTVAGPAVCDIPAGLARMVGSVRAQDMGTIGGHRVYASVVLALESAEPGQVALELGQGMEKLPPDAGMPGYGGLIVPIRVDLDAEGRAGTIDFAGLPASERPLVGGSWPADVAGRFEWTCDPIPDEPTPMPPGAVAEATLAGAVEGAFTLTGDDCPTPEHPDGFVIGTATTGDRQAILEVTIADDGVSFVLYPTPGDKNDMVRGKGPAVIRTLDPGPGWGVTLAVTSADVGPVTLDLRWRCEP